MKKASISSLESVMGLMESHPDLSRLPALQALRPLLGRPRASGCCNKVDLSPYRKAFEGALRTLTPDQQTQMKRILGVDQISYFTKVAGRLEQKTF